MVESAEESKVLKSVALNAMTYYSGKDVENLNLLDMKNFDTFLNNQ